MSNVYEEYKDFKDELYGQDEIDEAEKEAEDARKEAQKAKKQAEKKRKQDEEKRRKEMNKKSKERYRRQGHEGTIYGGGMLSDQPESADMNPFANA